MSAHYTPGPWRWWTSNSFRRLSSDATGKDGDVLYAYSSRDVADISVSDADMALIESAPLLLEALEGITALYDTDEGCRSTPEYIAARAAIAAATGEKG